MLLVLEITEYKEQAIELEQKAANSCKKPLTRWTQLTIFYQPPQGSSLGYKHTQETKEKISAAGKGRTYSEESKAKMSDIKKGSNNPMYGRTGAAFPRYGTKHSEETKAGCQKTF
jgi:hypothetical protein